jgi:hypothetical protein
LAGNSREHPRAKFVAIVKGENEIRPTFAREDLVGPSLAFYAPSDAK